LSAILGGDAAGDTGQSPDFTLRTMARLVRGLSLATVLPPIGSLVALATYARHLSDLEYARLDVVLAVSAIGAVIAKSGLDQVIAGLVAGQERDQRERGMSNALAACLAWAVVVGLSVLSLSGPLSAWLFGSESDGSLFVWTSMAVVASAVASLGVFMLQIRLAERRLTTYAFAAATTSILASAVFASVKQPTALRAVRVVAASSLVVAAVVILLVRPQFGGLRIRSMFDSLRSGWLLLPGAIGAIGVSYLDRFLLVHRVSSTDLARYALADRLSATVGLAVAVMFAAWWSIAIRRASPETGEIAGFGPTVERLVAAAAGASLIAVVLFRPVLNVIRPDAGAAAAPLGVWLTAFYGPSQMLLFCGGVPMQARKEFRRLGAAGVVAVVANLLGNLALVPRLGVAGSVVATVVAGAVAVFVNFRLAGPLARAAVRWRRLFVVGAPYVASIAAVSMGFGFVAVGACVCLCLVAAGSVGLIPGVEQRGLYAVRAARARSRSKR
jgi:O-antigen/teichoic acid export membrane protein